MHLQSPRFPIKIKQRKLTHYWHYRYSLQKIKEAETKQINKINKQQNCPSKTNSQILLAVHRSQLLVDSGKNFSTDQVPNSFKQFQTATGLLQNITDKLKKKYLKLK